jgi:hypothetical protein
MVTKVLDELTTSIYGVVDGSVDSSETLVTTCMIT